MALEGILVAAGAGGLMPLAGLVLKLSSQDNPAVRQVTTKNPWTWLWHLLFLPGAAVGYALLHDNLGQLDLASAFELGVGIPLVLKAAITRAIDPSGAKPGQ